MRLQVGDVAPEFDVMSSAGERLRLADFRGQKNVVLYFYPRDFSLGCTLEACQFRDSYEHLVGRQTVVIGVSGDAADRHEAFRREHGIPFHLVSDPYQNLTKKYAATDLVRAILGAPRRVTYVIDRAGMIAGIVASELRVRAHVDGVRAIVEKLERADAPTYARVP